MKALEPAVTDDLAWAVAAAAEPPAPPERLADAHHARQPSPRVRAPPQAALAALDPPPLPPGEQVEEQVEEQAGALVDTGGRQQGELLATCAFEGTVRPRPGGAGQRAPFDPPLYPYFFLLSFVVKN